MTQFEILPYRIATNVEVAVFHTKIVAAVTIVLNCEWRGLGLVQHIKLLHFYFNLTRGDLGVLRAALDDLAGHLDDVFASQLSGLLAERSIGLHVESQLRDTVAVAQVDKSHAAKVTAAL